jgi:hypothetical protein
VSEPSEALEAVADALRSDDTLLSGHLSSTDAVPALGLLAAAGPVARGAEGDYAFVVEAIREGYLLHYGEPRLIAGAEPGLALLAGDHLYALGLECLAGLGDLEAVRELADLISLSAQLHDDGKAGEAANALWLASVTAVAAGAGPEHAAAKESLRTGADPDAASAALAVAARDGAREAGIEAALAAAADSIDFDLPDPPAGG